VSFRLRIFLLVMITTVTAIGATAWLTLSLTSREVTRAQQASRQHRNDIFDTVQRYGLTHGAWPGIDGVAENLSEQTRLHIQLTTADGEILVDTDTMRGRRRGAVEAAPLTIDARPQMSGDIATRGAETAKSLPEALLRKKLGLTGTLIPPRDLFGPEPADPLYDSAAALVLRQAAQYRTALLTVQCIAKRTPGAVPALSSEDAPYLTAQQVNGNPGCVDQATKQVLTNVDWQNAAWTAATSCNEPTTGTADVQCLYEAFLKGIGPTAAVPLLLFLGAPAGTDIHELGRPAAVGIAGLLLVALAGTALIARRVSRPVGRLTMASRLLAAGRHDVRVPAVGDGELARLSASFNSMAEAVQRSEERQRRLVADVAHEMRTPLSNLRGYLEGLADGVVEPSRELFASLHEETLLQRRILDDLQVLADAESGELSYDRGLIDLAELAAGGVTAQRAVAYEAHVALHADTSVPVWVTADADRIRQVLGNLLTNAIRYTDAGGHILVRVWADRGTAVLSVQDTGVGIAPDDLRRVFDRFWRADPTRQRATGGTGLGLTIAQRIVTDHQGRIEVSSQPGAGTTFTVILPLSVVPQPFSAVPPR
jgi:two-component system, OmpR family, sensor histidine kinase BaeS